MSASIYPVSLRAWLEVDLTAVRHNARQLRERARCPLVAMVKANGYGLGAIPIARALGADFGQGEAPDAPWALGIATLDEAEALRNAGYRGRLLCCTPLLSVEYARALSLRVTPSLHRGEDISAWRGLGAAPYHLSIDTGMARAGARWDTVTTLRASLAVAPPEGVYTHLHSSEDSLASRDEQDQRFAQALAQLGELLPPGTLRHVDSSAGIASRAAGSPGELARPGIALYGAHQVAELGLQPVAHLRTRVIDLRDVHIGESVSYGATWTAERPSRIATLAAGYADGYRRHLSNVGEVLLHGHRCPVVGRVTMDMTMVDVTAVPCALGDVATLIGRDGPDCLTIDEVAHHGELSPYELLVGCALRVSAHYLPL